MGSLHNDLHTWASKARGKGQKTISLDVATADAISEKMVDQANRIMDLEHDLRSQVSPVDTLESSKAWLLRWAEHVGSCPTGFRCSCGLTAVRFDVENALARLSHSKTKSPTPQDKADV